MRHFIKRKLSNPIHAGWYVTTLGFSGFIFWASIFEVDQGIYAQGQIVVDQGKVSITAPINGQISELMVRPGSKVAEGDVLLQFDGSILYSKLSGIRESIAGSTMSIRSLEISLSEKMQQVTELEGQFESFTRLVETGFASKTYLMSLASQLSLARSELHQLTSTVEQSKARLRELASEELGVQNELDRLVVRSPIEGLVMNVSINSIKLNVTVGTQLLDVAPSNQGVIARVRIPPAYAIQVNVDDKVDLLFPTLPGSSMLRVSGVLFHVSGDQIVDDRTSEAYLEGYVRLVNQSDQAALGLRAGLPATVIVKAGSRTLMSYLTRPLRERLARGLH